MPGPMPNLANFGNPYARQQQPGSPMPNLASRGNPYSQSPLPGGGTPSPIQQAEQTVGGVVSSVANSPVTQWAVKNVALPVLNVAGRSLMPFNAVQQVLYGTVAASEDIISGKSLDVAWKSFARGADAAGKAMMVGGEQWADNFTGGAASALRHAAGMQDAQMDSGYSGYELIDRQWHDAPEAIKRIGGLTMDFFVDAPLIGKMAKVAKLDGLLRVDANMARSFTSASDYRRFVKAVVTAPLQTAPLKTAFNALPLGIRESLEHTVGNIVESSRFVPPGRASEAVGMSPAELLISGFGTLPGVRSVDIKSLRQGFTSEKIEELRKLKEAGDEQGYNALFKQLAGMGKPNGAGIDRTLQRAIRHWQTLGANIVARAQDASAHWTRALAFVNPDKVDDFRQLSNKLLDGKSGAEIEEAWEGVKKLIGPDHQALRQIGRAYERVAVSDTYNAIALAQVGVLKWGEAEAYRAGASLVSELTGEFTGGARHLLAKRDPKVITSFLSKLPDNLKGQLGDDVLHTVFGARGFTELKGDVTGLADVLPKSAVIRTVKDANKTEHNFLVNETVLGTRIGKRNIDRALGEFANGQESDVLNAAVGISQDGTDTLAGFHQQFQQYLQDIKGGREPGRAPYEVDPKLHLRRLYLINQNQQEALSHIDWFAPPQIVNVDEGKLAEIFTGLVNRGKGAPQTRLFNSWGTRSFSGTKEQLDSESPLVQGTVFDSVNRTFRTKTADEFQQEANRLFGFRAGSGGALVRDGGNFHIGKNGVPMVERQEVRTAAPMKGSDPSKLVSQREKKFIDAALSRTQEQLLGKGKGKVKLLDRKEFQGEDLQAARDFLPQIEAYVKGTTRAGATPDANEAYRLYLQKVGREPKPVSAIATVQKPPSEGYVIASPALADVWQRKGRIPKGVPMFHDTLPPGEFGGEEGTTILRVALGDGDRLGKAVGGRRTFENMSELPYSRIQGRLDYFPHTNEKGEVVQPAFGYNPPSSVSESYAKSSFEASDALTPEAFAKEFKSWWQDPNLNPRDAFLKFLGDYGVSKTSALDLVEHIGNSWDEEGAAIIWQPGGKELRDQVQAAHDRMGSGYRTSKNYQLASSDSPFTERSAIAPHVREAMGELQDIDTRLVEGARVVSKAVQARSIVDGIYNFLKDEGGIIHVDDVPLKGDKTMSAFWRAVTPDMAGALKTAVGDNKDVRWRGTEYIPAVYHRVLADATRSHDMNVVGAMFAIAQAKWKAHKVANPASIMRDMAGNLVLAERMGINPDKVIGGILNFKKLMDTAREGEGFIDQNAHIVLSTGERLTLKELVDKGDIVHPNFFVQEIVEPMRTAAEAIANAKGSSLQRLAAWAVGLSEAAAQKEGASKGLRTLAGGVDVATGMGGPVTNWLADKKGQVDSWFKAGAYIHLREQGKTAEEASDIADAIFYNYQNVPYLVDFARKMGVMPFAAFQMLSAGRFVKHLYDNPYGLARYYRTESMKGGEANQVNAGAPDYLGNETYLPLGKDSMGRVRWVALGSILPEQSITTLFDNPGLIDHIGEISPLVGLGMALSQGKGYQGAPTFATGGNAADTLDVDYREGARGILQTLGRFVTTPWAPGQGQSERIANKLAQAALTTDQIQSGVAQAYLRYMSEGIGAVASIGDPAPVGLPVPGKAPLPSLTKGTFDPMLGVGTQASNMATAVTDALASYAGAGYANSDTTLTHPGTAQTKMAILDAKLAMLDKEEDNDMRAQGISNERIKEIQKRYNFLRQKLISEQTAIAQALAGQR